MLFNVILRMFAYSFIFVFYRIWGFLITLCIISFMTLMNFIDIKNEFASSFLGVITSIFAPCLRVNPFSNFYLINQASLLFLYYFGSLTLLILRSKGTLGDEFTCYNHPTLNTSIPFLRCPTMLDISINNCTGLFDITRNSEPDTDVFQTICSSKDSIFMLWCLSNWIFQFIPLLLIFKYTGQIIQYYFIYLGIYEKRIKMKG